MHNAYELVKEENLGDLGSKGYVLRHKKSGAHISLIENDDDNKVFYIAFRTPPMDSTGVPHIIEHTVLCGSDKYPLKDPFVELVKGSMNTFLNAMTYPDKTVYPVASCNDQDFKNLMDVYMDAVFHPNIYKDPEIFMQEGWHYELESRDDDLTINAGSQIIDQLKENDQLGWTFVPKDAAIEGVKSGKYYAAIIIPQDFSESLLSVLSGKIETPELEYYINEKLNAIAPKITSSGASTIQTQVNNTFSSVASETIAEILKDSVFNISDSVDSTNAEINDLLTKANNNIKEYEQLLEKFSKDSSNTSKLIENAKDASTSLGDVATSGANALSSADSVMNTTRSSAGDFSSALSKSLSDGEFYLVRQAAQHPQD